MHRWMATDASGTFQRRYPGGATIRSLRKSASIVVDRSKPATWQHVARGTNPRYDVHEMALELISIELTNRCAKACWFCYNHSLPEGETRWSVEDVVGFVRDCA